MDREAGLLKKAGPGRGGILENLEEVAWLEKIFAGRRKSAQSGPGKPSTALRWQTCCQYLGKLGGSEGRMSDDADRNGV